MLGVDCAGVLLEVLHGAPVHGAELRDERAEAVHGAHRRRRAPRTAPSATRRASELNRNIVASVMAAQHFRL